MDKISYKLLKQLYKADLTAASIAALTEADTSKPNPYIRALASEGLVSVYSVGDTATGADFADGVEYWTITLKGRAYIEGRRKELLSFWLPYAITTTIAVAALFR